MKTRKDNWILYIGISTFWAVLALYYIALSNFEALILWVVLPVIFGWILFVAWRSRHIALTLFMGAVFLSHAILPSLFFANKENYSYSGWSAVKSFNFQLTDFFIIYLQILFYVVGVLLFTLYIRKHVFGVSALTLRLPSRANIPQTKKRKPTGSKVKYGVFLVLLIIGLSVINQWMFNMGIAMTGLTGQQIALPYRLGGILYYSTRFVFPLVVFVLYMHSSRSFFLASLLAIYAAWAGVSQLSRTTYVMYFIPVLAFFILDKKYLRGGLFALVFLILLNTIGYARSFVYLIYGNAVHRSDSYSLIELFYRVIEDQGSNMEIISVLHGLLGRIGGSQDVVLAYQYPTFEMGGSWVHFQHLFLYGAELSTQYITYFLYNFTLPSGFAVGTGGLSALVVIISGGNYFVLLLMSAWVSFWLNIIELIVMKFAKMSAKIEIGYMVGGLGIILFVTAYMGIFYGYIAMAFLFLYVCRILFGLHKGLKAGTVSKKSFPYECRDIGGR